MKFGDFIEYMVYNKDDSPLYLFESNIQKPSRGVTDLIKDYKVPKYFEDDYFKLIGDEERPPF